MSFKNDYPQKINDIATFVNNNQMQTLLHFKIKIGIFNFYLSIQYERK